MPACLRARLGRGEIVRSLGTCAPSVARQRSRLLWAATERVFEVMREVPTITPAAVEQLMAMLARDCAWADEVQFARAGRYFDVEGPAPADMDAIRFESEAHEFRQALACNDISSVHNQIARYAGKLGMTPGPGSLDERIIGRAVLRGFAEASELAASRLRAGMPSSEDSAVQQDATVADRFQASLAEAKTFNIVDPDGRDTCEPALTRSSPSRFTGLTIQQLWPTFCEDRVASLEWKRKIAQQSFGTMRAWVEVNGDGSPEAITCAPASEFRRVMRRLPGNYSKCKDWAGFSFAQIIARVTGTDYKPLAVTTWNRHVSVMSSFHEWIVRNELTSVIKNPFVGLRIEADEDLDVMEGGSQDRSMWSEDRLRALFASPLFLGCRSPYRRHQSGTLLIRDPLYWVVLIAALSGMRREEICQLCVRHVVRDATSGIVFFDLKALGLVLKNKESKRGVPLHEIVLELGFLEERVSGRSPNERLFPELEGQDNFGDKLGKQFTRYRKNFGIYEHLLDLHSFRHTVSTMLIWAGVPQAHAEEITGHRSEARRSAFADYDKGSTLRISKDALDRLVLPIDVAALLTAASR